MRLWVGDNQIKQYEKCLSLFQRILTFYHEWRSSHERRRTYFFGVIFARFRCTFKTQTVRRVIAPATVRWCGSTAERRDEDVAFTDASRHHFNKDCVCAIRWFFIWRSKRCTHARMQQLGIFVKYTLQSAWMHVTNITLHLAEGTMKASFGQTGVSEPEVVQTSDDLTGVCYSLDTAGPLACPSIRTRTTLVTSFTLCWASHSCHSLQPTSVKENPTWTSTEHGRFTPRRTTRSSSRPWVRHTTRSRPCHYLSVNKCHKCELVLYTRTARRRHQDGQRH